MSKKKDFEVIARGLIKYLQKGNFEQSFGFVLSDGQASFNFGTKYITDFDNLLFVSGMYGDISDGNNESMLCLGKLAGTLSNIDEDFHFEEILNYYYKSYKEWNVVGIGEV